MIQIKAPNSIVYNYNFTVFLAGSIEMGKADNWQSKVCQTFDSYDKLTFLNPRRDDWDTMWVQHPSNSKFKEQVDWELNGLNSSDFVFFYFDPNTISPVTLLELGLCIGLDKRIVVCCPDGYFRKGNVQSICNLYCIKVYDTLNDAMSYLDKYLQKYNTKA